MNNIIEDKLSNMINNTEIDRVPYLGTMDWIINIILYCIGKKSEIKERIYFKNKTYDKNLGTYLDQYGQTRLAKDDSKVFINRNACGEKEIRYQNGKLRNLTQEDYIKRIGTVTQLTGYTMYNGGYCNQATGIRYKDKATGDIYVIRLLRYDNNVFNFYVRADNGIVVRPTDGQLKLERKAKTLNKKYYSENNFKNMVLYFNKMQDKSRKATLYRNKYNSSEYSEEDIESLINYR